MENIEESCLETFKANKMQYFKIFGIFFFFFNSAKLVNGGSI